MTVNHAARAPGRLYRHVGLNLYDQPLSRGRISSAIGAAVSVPSSPLPPDTALEASAVVAVATVAKTSRRRRLSVPRQSTL